MSTVAIESDRQFAPKQEGPFVDLLNNLPPDSIRHEMDRLADEGMSVIVIRRPDQVLKMNGKEITVPIWEVQIPTMKLKAIPKAISTDPIIAIANAEQELRTMLKDAQYHHKP